MSTIWRSHNNYPCCFAIKILLPSLNMWVCELFILCIKMLLKMLLIIVIYSKSVLILWSVRFRIWRTSLMTHATICFYWSFHVFDFIYIIIFNTSKDAHSIEISLSMSNNEITLLSWKKINKENWNYIFSHSHSFSYSFPLCIPFCNLERF